MKLFNFHLHAVLDYTEDSIESFILVCEQVINNIETNESVKFSLKNMVNELVVNCIEHGYKKENGPVDITIDISDKYITFEICDEGNGIDISTLDLEREANTEQDLSSRGWGLAILNKLSSSFKIEQNNPQGSRITISIPNS